MDESNQMSRRSFLSLATWSLGGFMAGMLGIPAIAFILGPAFSGSKEQAWIRLGSTRKVELGTPALFHATITRNSGWLVEQEKISVYVLTDNGRDFIAMSNICTHLGCRVRWIADQQIFLSPCHNGVFDREGRVVSGPPPRPLDRFEIRIENEQIYIGQKHILKNGQV